MNRYIAAWGAGHYAEFPFQFVQRTFFHFDNGYDEDAQAVIDNLAPGDCAQFSGNHSVVRLADTTPELDRRRDVFLSDILCTAAEGGINYWCDFDSIQDINDDFAYVKLFHCADCEDLEDQFPDITKDTIETGIARILNGSVEVRDDLMQIVAAAQFTHDASNIDAEGADVIVQAGLFKEVRYG